MGDREHFDPELCAALDCPTRVGRNVLMCRRHAAMVPTAIGDALLREPDGTPIKVKLIEAAIQSVAAKEGRRFYPLPEFHQG